MELGTFRGLMTALLMGLFVWFVLWAYGRGRRADFAAAATLPLEDDTQPPAPREDR